MLIVQESAVDMRRSTVTVESMPVRASVKEHAAHRDLFEPCGPVNFACRTSITPPVALEPGAPSGRQI